MEMQTELVYITVKVNLLILLVIAGLITLKSLPSNSLLKGRIKTKNETNTKLTGRLIQDYSADSVYEEDLLLRFYPQSAGVYLVWIELGEQLFKYKVMVE